MSDPKKAPAVPDGKKEATSTTPITLTIQEPPTPAHAEALKKDQTALNTNNQGMQNTIREAAEKAAKKLKESTGPVLEATSIAVGLTMNPGVQAQAPAPIKTLPVQPAAIVEVQDAASVKQDLYAFLLSRKLERFGPQFEALSTADQGKVLSYFVEGKKSQPDEKTLGKGVVNYITYLAQVIENDKIIKYYEANHQLPKKSDAAGSLASYAKFVIAAFTGADKYADMSACDQIDALIVGWYKEANARGKAEIARDKAEIAKMQEEIALYKRLLGRK